MSGRSLQRLILAEILLDLHGQDVVRDAVEVEAGLSCVTLRWPNLRRARPIAQFAARDEASPVNLPRAA
jgi:hypothetical protein